MPEIPADLAEKYGQAALENGIAALEKRRGELPRSERRPVQEWRPPAPVQVYDPFQVKLWPVVGLAAVRLNRGGAYRVWALARTVDPQGSGVVSHDTLADYCAKLGVHKRSFRRWLMAALKLGIMRQVIRKSGETVYLLVSLGRAAELLGCEWVGQPVQIPAPNLVEAGWRSWLWAGYLATTRNRPISRAKMRALTGVPEQTQRNYEKESGVEIVSNYGVTNEPCQAQFLSGYQEVVKPHAFAFKDKSTKDAVIAYQIPNMYVVPGAVVQQPKGRSRKAQKTLNAALFIVEQGLSKCVRLYNQTRQAARTSLRKLARLDERPPELYVFRYAGRSVSWSVVPV